MAKKITKYKFETTDKEEANRWIASSQMANILFNLQNNFWRKWKYTDPPSGIEVLDALKEELSEIDTNNLVT